MPYFNVTNYCSKMKTWFSEEKKNFGVLTLSRKYLVFNGWNLDRSIRIELILSKLIGPFNIFINTYLTVWIHFAETQYFTTHDMNSSHSIHLKNKKDRASKIFISETNKDANRHIRNNNICIGEKSNQHLFEVSFVLKYDPTFSVLRK